MEEKSGGTKESGCVCCAMWRARARASTKASDQGSLHSLDCMRRDERVDALYPHCFSNTLRGYAALTLAQVDMRDPPKS